MAKFGVEVVFMLFTLVAVGTSSLQERKPFIDPRCLARDCSWSWETPTAGTQFCGQVTYSTINICPDGPFGSPSKPEDRPGSAMELHVTDVNRHFNSSGIEGDTLEQHTCLVIKYKIKQHGSAYIKGLQVSVRGKQQPDLNYFDCIVRNFSSGLQSYSVKNRVFTNECFCGVKPGRLYQIIVRTLPVDDIDFDQYDTQINTSHQPAGCESENKVDDVRCHISDEARWSPECIIAKQKTQSGDYDIVEVTFAIAPESYNFDMYKVLVYRSGVQERNKDYAEIQTHSTTVVNVTCRTSFHPVPAVTHRFNVSVTPWLGSNIAEMFYLKIQPKPSRQNNQCRNAEGVADKCKLSISDSFRVIPNPCRDDPCNPPDITNVVGTCIPEEENYTCRCGPGYTEHGGTCIVDPCQFSVEAGSTWDHHCNNGQCIYSPDRTDFACSCDANFVYLKTLKMCEADPCAANSETNVTICGMHGKCKMNLTNDHVSFSCICDEGYIYDETCEAKASVGMIVGIALGSSLIGLLLFLAIICFFRNGKLCTEDDTPPPPPIEDSDETKPDPVSRRRVLPIFSDDHKYHKQVVHCFCRLLKTHCKCDVSLWEWQNSVGPTVEMWLTTEIEAADVVLLICSKGTGLKYKAKAKQDEVGNDSQGVYGDVFVKALTLLDQYFKENNASEKFVVAYFDYSSENHIPVSFRRFAKYHLMDSMESLYLRIHNKLKDSPNSSRRVSMLEEPNYRELEMGRPLYKAIQDMKALIKAEPNWYKKGNTRSFPEPELSLSVSADPNPFIQQSSIVDGSLDRQNSRDSACDSGIQISVPSGFFRGSCSSVDDNDLEKSMQKLLSMSPQQNGHAIIDMPQGNLEDSYVQPRTKFFSEDMHLTMNTELHDPFQSGEFYSDVQMGNTRPRQDRAGSFA